MRVEAVAKPGWIFVGWTGNTSDPLNALNILTLGAGSAVLSAHFIAELPVVTSVSVLPGNTHLRAEFSGTPFAPYKVESSTGLSQWADAGTFTTAADGTGNVQVPIAPGVTKLFLRAMAAP